MMHRDEAIVFIPSRVYTTTRSTYIVAVKIAEENERSTLRGRSNYIATDTHTHLNNFFLFKFTCGETPAHKNSEKLYCLYSYIFLEIQTLCFFLIFSSSRARRFS